MANSKQLMVVSTARGTLVGEIERNPEEVVGDVYPLRKCLAMDSFPGNPALALFAYPVPAHMLPESMDLVTRIPKVTVAAYTTIPSEDTSSDLVEMYYEYWSDEDEATAGIDLMASDTGAGSQPPVQ